jgi:hypothetical protein
MREAHNIGGRFQTHRRSDLRVQTGARNMIGIGVYDGSCRHQSVPCRSHWRWGLVMTELVEKFSVVTLMLVLVAVISLILGMGPPTTPTMIVFHLDGAGGGGAGAQSGSSCRPSRFNSFVFLFRLMVDVTPPGWPRSRRRRSRSTTRFRWRDRFSQHAQLSCCPVHLNTQPLLIDLEGPLHPLITVP